MRTLPSTSRTTRPSGNLRRRSRSWLLSAAVLATASPAALAIDRSWNLSLAQGFWDDPANWNPAGQPQSGDAVFLVSADNVARTVVYRNTVSPTPSLGGVVIAASGGGTMTLSQTQDDFSGGYLSIGGDIGTHSPGSGSYVQSGGTAAAINLYMGNSPTSTGTYILSGGSFSTGAELIGNGGAATVQQSGGANTLIDLELNQSASDFSANYQMTAGSLSASQEVVGRLGPASFVQSGGTNSVASFLLVAQQAGVAASYQLSNTASLSVMLEQVGILGAGTFTQSSGSNVVGGLLELGSGGGGSGTYVLDTGSVSSSNCNVGQGGYGLFQQNGGSNVVSKTLTIAPNYLGGLHAAYHLGGGTVVAAALVNNDTFAQTAGVATFGTVSGAGTLSVTGGTLTAASIKQAALVLGGTGAVILQPGATPNAQTNMLRNAAEITSGFHAVSGTAR